jgi:hypothetical protein
VCQACGKRGADVRPDFNWKPHAQESMPRYVDSYPESLGLAGWGLHNERVY